MQPLTDPSTPLPRTVDTPGHIHPATDRRDPWRQQASQAAHPSAAQSEIPLVEAIAAGLASVVVPWELDGRSTDAPTNELILSTEMYDAWVIHWPPGHADEPHAHHGSDGAFAVVSGTLDEERRQPDGSFTTARIDAGGSQAFDDATVHRVVNRAATTATSVHVYSPPLGRPRHGSRDDTATDGTASVDSATADTSTVEVIHTPHPHADPQPEETT